MCRNYTIWRSSPGTHNYVLELLGLSRLPTDKTVPMLRHSIIICPKVITLKWVNAKQHKAKFLKMTVRHLGSTEEEYTVFCLADVRKPRCQ